MKRAVLIWMGGLAAMVGGVASATLGLLYALQARGASLGSTGMALQKGHYQNQVLTMLLVGVLAAIAALHVLQRSRYGSVGALASVAAFVGVAMTVGGNLVGELLPAMAGVALLMMFGGLLAASAGVLVLGIVTITTQALPRWCGVALIAGSPPGVFLGFMVVNIVEVLLGALGARSEVPGGMGWGGLWALAGVAWIVVGYALFRAATRQAQQPSRAR
jgi:hypothetical protein